MYKKMIATAWLLCFTASNCFATDWTTIIEKENYQIQVDIDSYKVEASLPLMTIKTLYKTAQQHPKDSNTIDYVSSIEKMQFNCQQPYYRILTKQLFDQTDQLVFNKKKATDFKKIEMGTDNFSIGQLTCQVHQMLGGQ